MANVHPYQRFLSELRSARAKRGFTQGVLAQKIGLSRAQMTSIENGRSIVNFTHLHNLSVALGVRWTIGDPTFPPASGLKQI